MNLYLKVINQYFDFSGRARRKEYWLFTLISIIITTSLSILDLLFETFYFTTASYIYSMLVFIPSISVLLRRLHDIGKSGWYLFLLLIPFIGWVWLLVLLCMEGEHLSNKWGKNPKGLGSDRLINQIGTE
jgi:uncharacterized membrane protein YhaH (DUF805 family)